MTLLEALGDSADCSQRLSKKLGVKDTGDCKAALAILTALRILILQYTSLAKNGNPVLIHELPIYARQMVEALDDIAGEHPEMLAENAQHQVDWPILAARHYPKESDFKELAEAINLGTKVVVNTSPRARYKLKTPINRFLLKLLGGSIATAKEFYFVQQPDEPPKLTNETLPYYLDDFIMPLLDEIRQKEGSWDGLPVVADILKRVPYESEHRSAVRNRIKRALKALANRER